MRPVHVALLRAMARRLPLAVDAATVPMPDLAAEVEALWLLLQPHSTSPARSVVADWRTRYRGCAPRRLAERMASI